MFCSSLLTSHFSLKHNPKLHSFFLFIWPNKSPSPQVPNWALLILIAAAAALVWAVSARRRMKVSRLAWLLSLLLCFTLCLGYNVSYDRRSLIINGQRKLLISAAIHYPRSVPAVTLQIHFTLFFINGNKWFWRLLNLLDCALAW